MLKDKFDKIKLLFSKNSKKDKENNESIEKNKDISNKKKIENLAVFLVILIITLIIINFIWNDSGDNTNNDKKTDSNKKLAETNINETNITSGVGEDNSTYNMKDELEEILSNINGVGKVKVMITYASTETTIPVYNEESTEENTEETDSEGGTRTVTQTDVKKEVIYEENDGNKTLITQKTTSPEIEGAIITAEGADSVEIKTNIIQAVEAVTGLPTHRIQVFKMST